MTWDEMKAWVAADGGPTRSAVEIERLPPSEWHPDCFAHRLHAVEASLERAIEDVAREREVSAKLRADLRKLMASAARPLVCAEERVMPAGFGECPHCNATFLSEVVGTHAASCELRPAVGVAMLHDHEAAAKGECLCPGCARGELW